MNTLTLTQYTQQARQTAVYPDVGNNADYILLGLTEEIGEFAGHFKRVIRDDGGIITPERKASMSKELGDIAWYLAGLSWEFAQANVDDQWLEFVCNTTQGYADILLVMVSQINRFYNTEHKHLYETTWIDWSIVCHSLDLNPLDVLQANLDKLQDRAERNMLHGEGDER